MGHSLSSNNSLSKFCLSKYAEKHVFVYSNLHNSEIFRLSFVDIIFWKY